MKRFKSNRNNRLFVFSFILIALVSCSKVTVRNTHENSNKSIERINKVDKKPYLKAHFNNGELVLLSGEWVVDTLSQLIKGKGKRYDYNRIIIDTGLVEFYYKDVVLFETNENFKNTETERFAAITVMTIADLALGIYCASHKKACFGSCPTFYVDGNSDLQYADAEGFSEAILPSLEYGDIDALGKIKIDESTFSITMKNEALETHSIRKLEILAFPLSGNERVYQSVSDEFYKSSNSHKLIKAIGPEGDISRLLNKHDRIERISLADSINLNTKEDIILEFNRNSINKELALLVNFRQSLLTSYLFYNSMGYMGDKVSDYFSMMETKPEYMNKLKNGIKKELGKIVASVWDDENETWQDIGSFFESGPIAFNRQIIPFTSNEFNNEIRIKLTMTKGYWKIDGAELLDISEKLGKEFIQIDKAYKNNKVSVETYNKLSRESESLISMPGDVFLFDFKLPEANISYDIFLYSKGYYIEWMRESWLADKNLSKLLLMLESPKEYLGLETLNYKDYEQSMEKIFGIQK